MHTKITTAVLALCLGLGTTSAIAQSEDDTASTGDGSDLSLGEVVTDGPRIGERYIVETSRDWNIRCVKTEDGNDPCQLQQSLRDKDDNLVAEITMNPIQNGGQVVAGANLITPLETSLQEQVTIQVDDAQAKRYPFAFCATIGCVARIGLTAEDIAAYKAGNAAKIRIVPFAAPDQTVNLTVSLTGFTAAYDKLN